MNLKHKILGLVLFFSLIHLNTAGSFFQDNHSSGKTGIAHLTRENSPLDNNVFQLYDNFSSRDTDYFVSKGRDDFISADQIEVRMPLKILSRESIYPENSIDRMLLANLRAKKLILEYEQLQQKNRLLLQNNPQAGSGPGNELEKNKEALSRHLLNISRLGRLTRDGFASNDIMFAENVLLLNNETKQVPLEYVDFSGVEEPAARAQAGETADYRPGTQVISRQGSTELPWLFKLFIKLLNYGMSNRFEVCLIAAFVAVIGFIISLQVKS